MSASPFMTAIRRHAAERPRAPALTCGESRLDWAGFAAAVEQAAAAFRRLGHLARRPRCDRRGIVAGLRHAVFRRRRGRGVHGADAEQIRRGHARTPDRRLRTEDPDRGCRGRRDPGGLQAGRRRRDRSRLTRPSERSRSTTFWPARGMSRSRNYRAMRRSTSSIRPARPACPRASFIRRRCGSGRRRGTPS